jgi:two-component system NarL family sensor kinase
LTAATQVTRSKELRILYAVAEELNGAAEMREALERLLALVAELLHLQAGWIWLFDAETRRFYNAASFNLPPYLREPVRMAGTWCQCTQLFREGKLSPKNIDIIECSRLAPAVERKLTAQTAGLRYHASVPLYFRGKQLGIMNLTGPRFRRLSGGELRILGAVALQAGATIERARLAEDFARLARVEERARLAREIHDTLVQQLTAVALQLEGALKHLDGASTSVKRAVKRALEITRDGIKEARRSIVALRETPLRDKPLEQALASIARTFTSGTGIPVRLAIERVELAPAVESEVVRIVREAFTNVGKHARATAVTLGLSKKGSFVQVSVRDNGVGMKAERQTSGHGIVGMQERARIAGGMLHIISRRGRGTTVTLRIPARAVQR